MRPARGLAALLLAAGLGGCYDLMPHVRLYNNTGAPLTVLAKVGPERVRRIELEPGARTHRPIAYGYASVVAVAAGPCTYTYRVPLMQVNHPFGIKDGYRYPVQAQTEPDFSVVLMPDRAKAVAPADPLAEAQRHGFPLRPLERVCEETDAAGPAEEAAGGAAHP